MNGTILWSGLIVHGKVRSGKMRRMFCTFVIGHPWGDKPYAEQVNEIICCHFSIYCYLICYYLQTAVRGMMYYRRALRLQAFLDMASDEGNVDWEFWWYIWKCDMYLAMVYIYCPPKYCRNFKRVQGSYGHCRGREKKSKIYFRSTWSCCWYEVYLRCYLPKLWKSKAKRRSTSYRYLELDGQVSLSGFCSLSGFSS